MTRRHTLILVLTIVMVVIIDQIIKFDVKTTMTLSQHIHVTDWFQIAFVENKGMAFGWTFGTKTFLSIFRIATVALLLWYVLRLIKRQLHTGFVVCIALIIAGAIGNIIDSIFYGMIFSQSTHTEVATLTAWGEGYGRLLEGKVVDMFYFPLVEWNMPASWTWLNHISLLPNAGEHCVFFSPVFNFADSCISIGVCIMVLFFRQSFSRCFNISRTDDTTTPADGTPCETAEPAEETTDDTPDGHAEPAEETTDDTPDGHAEPANETTAPSDETTAPSDETTH